MRTTQPVYTGSFEKQPLIRIGKQAANELLTAGWRLARGTGSAYEVIDPNGYAQYWLARRPAQELIAAAEAAGEPK